MPSFDIVSEVDHHELTNAIDQTKREVSSRFDFRGVDLEIKLNEFEVTLVAEADFQLQQLVDILQNKLVKREIDISCLELKPIEKSGKQVIQVIAVRQGIEGDFAKKITKLIKEEKLKVQASIQGDQVRVTGKKRDDLQTVIAFLRDKDLEQPLQFKNFRD